MSYLRDIPMQKLTEFLSHANLLADQAGQLAQKYFRSNIDMTLKPGHYPVTSADLAIEQLMRESLLKRFPDHGILGEEYGTTQGSSQYLWVIDPIDGTTAFAAGKPTFTTLIALLENGRPLLGIIDQPILNERWLGVIETQTRWNGSVCKASSVNSLSSAKLNCTTADMFPDRLSQKIFHQLKQKVASLSYGGDAYSYGLLAAGHIDVILEADLKFYDVAALIPILIGAGAVMTDWQGNPIVQPFAGTCLAAANPQLHHHALEVIKHVTK